MSFLVSSAEEAEAAASDEQHQEQHQEHQEQHQVQFRERINGLVYRTATQADVEAVWRAMLVDFFPRMPLFQHLGVDNVADVAPIRGLLPGIIAHGVTIVAEEEATAVADSDDGSEHPLPQPQPKLVGVRTSLIAERDRPAPKHPLVADPELAARHPKASCVLRLVDQVSSAVDCLRLYNVDRALALRFLVVSQSHSGRGVGRQLMECSLRLGRQLGLQLAVGTTQSFYAQRIYQAMEFDQVYAMSIPDFVDPLTGQKPFAGLADSVHKETVCYAKRL